MTTSHDILVEIPDENLYNLLEIYKDHVNWAPQVFSFIKTGIKWKKLNKYRHLITFMSPGNSWKTDGTIIVLMEFFCYDLFVFTLEKSCNNLYNGLMKTARIDYRKKILFFSIHNDHVQIIRDVLKKKNLQSKNDETMAMSITIEEAKKFTLNCSSDVYVAKLEPNAARQINAIWPNKYEDSEMYISTLLEMNGGYGVFLKSTNEMVAWIVTHCLGHLGMVQTEEKYKKKGYGSLVTKTLSRDMAEKGVTPFGTIQVTNAASRNMFKKLGFRELGICTYLSSIPSDPQ